MATSTDTTNIYPIEPEDSARGLDNFDAQAPTSSNPIATPQENVERSQWAILTKLRGSHTLQAASEGILTEPIAAYFAAVDAGDSAAAFLKLIKLQIAAEEAMSLDVSLQIVCWRVRKTLNRHKELAASQSLPEAM